MKKAAGYILAICMVAVLAGCTSPSEKPAEQPEKNVEVQRPAPELSSSEQFYKDEGAHFENPMEFWVVTGKLETKNGPVYFASHFQKTGNMYLHARNAYNSLRMPDGQYNYRSVGQPMVKQLGANRLKEKMQKYPDAGYGKVLEDLQNDRAEHFTMHDDEHMGLHRNHLFIDFGKNHLERMSETEFKYDLNLDTWAGMLELKMESKSDPAYFDSINKIDIMNGYLQGYFFPFIEIEGKLVGENSSEDVKGTAWMNHVWGEPKSPPLKSVYATITTDAGGAFVLIVYYDADGIVSNRNFLYSAPDGQTKRNWDVKLESVETWTSDASKFLYDIAWKAHGEKLSGDIIPKFKDSEIMLEHGVGPFWMGPCDFDGELEGRKTTGEGYCRVSGVEQ